MRKPGLGRGKEEELRGSLPFAITATIAFALSSCLNVRLIQPNASGRRDAELLCALCVSVVAISSIHAPRFAVSFLGLGQIGDELVFELLQV